MNASSPTPTTIQEAAAQFGAWGAYELARSGRLGTPKPRGRIFTTTEDIHEYALFDVLDMPAGVWAIVEPPDGEALILMRDRVAEAGGVLGAKRHLAAEKG